MTVVRMTSPDGTALPLTHLQSETGRGFRIVTDGRDLVTGRPVLILADDAGGIFTIDPVDFYSGAYEYRPGGQ